MLPHFFVPWWMLGDGVYGYEVVAPNGLKSTNKDKKKTEEEKEKEPVPVPATSCKSVFDPVTGTVVLVCGG